MSALPRLEYEVHGSGPPMLMVHGFASSRFTWRNLVEAYEHDYTVITVDLLGHGASPKPRSADYSISYQARLLHELIREKELSDLTLLGHSYGGAVALKLCLDLLDESSDCLRRLVLIGGAAYQQPFPPFIGILRRPILGRIIPLFAPPMFSAKRALQLAIHDQSRVTPEQLEGWAAPNREPGIKNSLRQTALQILPDNLASLTSRYSEIEVPTLLMWGSEDRVVPLSIGQRLSKEIPKAELHIVDDCGHIPHEELPEDTLDILDPFLERS